MFACLYTAKPCDSLAQFAYSFSPLVEETAAGTVVINVEGCELLFGSAYELANQVVERARKPEKEGGVGTKLSVAIASNPDAAIHAATRLRGVTFISPGEELTCLGEFPIRALNHSLITIDDKRAEEIFETLDVWGIRTFADFAALPTAGISERLGQDGIHLQQLARGATQRHLKLNQPPRVFANTIELDHPISELEPLSFIFARLLNQLCAALNGYALATNELIVQMKLSDQTMYEHKLTLPYAMRDHKVFLKLLLLTTERNPPQQPVETVSITCEPVKPRLVQNGLFIPLAPEPEKLELTLARLAQLVGPQNVGSPALLDTYRPDAFCLNRFALKTDKKLRGRVKHTRKSPIGNRRAVLAFRTFRPALRAVVQTEQGWPSQISAWGKQQSVYGKVVRLAGPWRTTGDWWRDDRWARDEWDLALQVVEAGKPQQTALYRIYRDLTNGSWFVEGSYD
ncbi:MAG: hypothetical protein ABR555_01945 [Pyrinomonadaceae bacterium]